MKRVALLALMLVSGRVFADQALVLNCIFETNEAYVVENLTKMAMVPSGGVEFNDLVSAIQRGQDVLNSGDIKTMTRSGDTLTTIGASKIIRIDAKDGNYKRVCVLLQGEAFQRDPVK